MKKMRTKRKGKWKKENENKENMKMKTERRKYYFSMDCRINDEKWGKKEIHKKRKCAPMFSTEISMCIVHDCHIVVRGRKNAAEIKRKKTCSMNVIFFSARKGKQKKQTTKFFNCCSMMMMCVTERGTFKNQWAIDASVHEIGKEDPILFSTKSYLHFHNEFWKKEIVGKARLTLRRGSSPAQSCRSRKPKPGTFTVSSTLFFTVSSNLLVKESSTTSRFVLNTVSMLSSMISAITSLSTSVCENIPHLSHPDLGNSYSEKMVCQYTK